MWEILLKCILALFYLLGIYLFVVGYNRYKISFGWLALLVFFPVGMIAVYEWQVNKHRPAGSPVMTSNRVHVLFAIACSAAIYVTPIYFYYKIMDGASVDMLAAMNKTTAIWVIAISAIYAVYRIAQAAPRK